MMSIDPQETLNHLTNLAVRVQLTAQRVSQTGPSKTSSEEVVEVPHSFHKVKVDPPKKKPFVGYVDFQGLEIDIEVKAGQYREKTDPEGKTWRRYMHHHYGEIRGTEATDGDLLDVYVGPNHDSSLVVVIHQHRPDDLSFDEDKVMVGFDSVEEAIGAYKKHYPKPGFYQEGEHKAFPIGRFWRWVKDERNHGKKVAATKFTVSLVDTALKKASWRSVGNGWEERIAGFYSVNFIESRRGKGNPSTFQVVWYTGKPGQYRDSQSVDSIKEAVRLGNQKKPESDLAASLEDGEDVERVL